MTSGLEPALPIEGASTSFDRDGARGKRLNFSHQPVAPHTPSQDQAPFGILPMQLEYVLGQIDPDECHFHVPSPSG